MCIAIYKPENIEIPKETLETCFENNPDGAGYMFAEDKKLHVRKGFFDMDKFWNSYKRNKNKQAVIHFRIKTHGKITKSNCHPFNIHNGLAFVHNGIITGYGNDATSDTKEFSRKMLQPLVAKWGNLALFQDPMINLIENRIGYSKLVFLDRHGNAKIFNEQKGNWKDKCWFSNKSYEPKPEIVYTPTNRNNLWSGYGSYATRSTNNNTKYYGRSYISEPTQQELLPSSTKEFNHPLEAGDYVELIADFKDDGAKKTFHKGTIAEIICINNDFSADLMDEENGFMYNVPYSHIEYCDEFMDDTVVDSETPVDWSTKYEI